MFLRNKKHNQQGIALVLTIVTLAVSFAIVLSLASIFLLELRASNLAVDSTKSFYAADAAVERALFKHRQENSPPANESGDVDSSHSWEYQTQCPVSCQNGKQCNEIRATGSSGATKRVLTARYIVDTCP